MHKYTMSLLQFTYKTNNSMRSIIGAQFFQMFLLFVFKSHVTECSQCDNGFYMDQALCVQCSPGTYMSKVFVAGCDPAAVLPHTKTHNCKQDSDCGYPGCQSENIHMIYGCFIDTDHAEVTGLCWRGISSVLRGLCDSPPPCLQGCYLCPVNSHSSAGSSIISDCHCNPGYRESTGGSDKCIACTAGKFNGAVRASQCIDCPMHSYSEAGATVCLCNAGYESAPGDTCVPCGMGKYKTQPGSEKCTQCPVGEYSTITGAVSAISCIACAAHTGPRSDGGGCESCASRYSARVLTSAFYGDGEMPACIEFVQ